MKRMLVKKNSPHGPLREKAPRYPRPSSGPAIDIFAEILRENTALYQDLYENEHGVLLQNFRARKLPPRLRSLNSRCLHIVELWIKIADLKISESNKFSAYLWLRNHILRKYNLSWTLGHLHRWHSKKIGKRRRRDSKPKKRPREIPKPDAFAYDQMRKTNPEAYEELSNFSYGILKELLALHFIRLEYSYIFDGLWIEFRSGLAKTLTKEKLRHLIKEWERDDRRPSRLP